MHGAVIGRRADDFRQRCGGARGARMGTCHEYLFVELGHLGLQLRDDLLRNLHAVDVLLEDHLVVVDVVALVHLEYRNGQSSPRAMSPPPSRHAPMPSWPPRIVRAKRWALSAQPAQPSAAPR